MAQEHEFDIKKFYSYKENNRLEVKRASGGLPGSLWETYSSFANCDGGVIILGAIENADGSITTTGLADDRRLKKELFDTVNNPKKVSINLLMDKDVQSYVMDNGDVVLVVHIPPANREDRPVYINDNIFGGTFRRNWEGDYHCTKSEIKAMLRDQPNDSTDAKILTARSLADLDYESVHSYRNRHVAHKETHVWRDLQDHDYLERIGAAKIGDDGALYPTAAGLLMFGYDYRINYEFPEYFLDYREELDPATRWTDRVYSGTGDWSGNLYEFLFRVIPKLTQDIKIPFKLDGIVRVDDTPVHRAMREAFANCIINADFFLPKGIVILKHPDRIVFENPGGIRIGKAQMLKGGVSDPRNKTIMKMLNLIGIGERAGSGVPDIYAVWKNQGWREPEVEESYNPDRTVLILPMSDSQEESHASGKTADAAPKQKLHDKPNHKTEKIIQLLRDRAECTTHEIAEYLGLKAPRTRQILNELADKGIIIAEGNNRNRKYKISDSKISDFVSE